MRTGIVIGIVLCMAFLAGCDAPEKIEAADKAVEENPYLSCIGFFGNLGFVVAAEKGPNPIKGDDPESECRKVLAEGYMDMDFQMVTENLDCRDSEVQFACVTGYVAGRYRSLNGDVDY